MLPENRLKIGVKLLLNVYRKSYMPRRLVEQRMTLSDLEWPFHASRATSAVAELLVIGLTLVVSSSQAQKHETEMSTRPTSCRMQSREKTTLNRCLT